MSTFFDKIFLRSNNLDHISKKIKDISQKTPADKIFKAVNSFSPESEIRYVGGCIRKIISKEKIDDIDLATNLQPKQVCNVLKENNIDYYETGVEHGTITAVIKEYKFEITTLREDISTDGRHAKVQFSQNWKKDASRRDFTINSIYSDKDGNLFDPFNGKKDLENGDVKFIGNVEKRIREDYLRILRYLRFFSNYSKKSHDLETLKKLKMNINGVSKISKERLLDELKKMINYETLEKLSKNKISLDLFLIIFPEIKNIKIFSKLKPISQVMLKKKDFIFLLSFLIIDETDNVDYFLYKFNISKKDKNRIKIIDDFYKEEIKSTMITKKNMNKYFYYQGKQAVIDIISFSIIKSKKSNQNLIKLLSYYEKQSIPKIPISAGLIMSKYDIAPGKGLGLKLKMIEEEWVKNGFEISNEEVENIIKS